MPDITYIFGGQEKKVTGKDGESLLQIALDNGIPMEHACGGNGFCTTCMCTVKSGMENLSPRNDNEENMGVTDDPMRLSCQSQVKGDVVIEMTDF